MDNSENLRDLVDYDKHATELADYIKSSLTPGDNINDIETNSIAIKGDWGMGKSFLIKLLKKKLKEKKYSNLNLNIVDFDPWKLAGNKNNEIEILKAVLNNQNKRTKRIEGYLKFADRTTKFFSAGILGFLIIEAKPLLEYMLKDILEPIFQRIFFFLPQILEFKTLYSFNSFPIIPFLSFLLILFIAIPLIYLEFKKPSYHDIDYFITSNTLIIIDNIDRCTPEEIFDVLRCVEIYNKLKLGNVKIITLCVFKSEVIESAIKRMLSFEIGDKNPSSYIEKLFKFPINLNCSKGLFISQWIVKNLDKRAGDFVPSIKDCLDPTSSDILGNFRELNIKLGFASEYAKKRSINKVIFILLLLLSSLHAPSSILSIIHEEEINRNPEEKDFNKSINNFFEKDLNGNYGEYLKRVYTGGNAGRTVPFKLHTLMHIAKAYLGVNPSWEKYDLALKQYYGKRILTQELFRFFNSHMR